MYICSPKKKIPFADIATRNMALDCFFSSWGDKRVAIEMTKRLEWWWHPASPHIAQSLSSVQSRLHS
jgi:hypothetical protein